MLEISMPLSSGSSFTNVPTKQKSASLGAEFKMFLVERIREKQWLASERETSWSEQAEINRQSRAKGKSLGEVSQDRTEASENTAVPSNTDLDYLDVKAQTLSDRRLSSEESLAANIADTEFSEEKDTRALAKDAMEGPSIDTNLPKNLFKEENVGASKQINAERALKMPDQSSNVTPQILLKNAEAMKTATLFHSNQAVVSTQNPISDGFEVGLNDNDQLSKVVETVLHRQISDVFHSSVTLDETRKPLAQAVFRSDDVARQFAEAIQKNADGRVELRLNPHELGRVQIQMITADNGMLMSVNAERPETTELLRRHIDLLAQELAELGYTDIDFDFGNEGENGAQRASYTLNGTSDDLDASLAAQAEADPAMTSQDGLDIRI